MSAVLTPAPTHSRYYIGGGNIAGIIGVSPFRTPLDEYHTIIGDNPELSASNENFFRRRRALEPFAAAVLEERGFTILRQNERYTDPEYPFLRAEIDAETMGLANQLRNGEFKSVHPLAAKQWGFDGDAEGAPTYVTAQAQWGLGVTKRAEADIFAVIGFDDARLYPIHAAQDVIDFMRQRAVEFWEQNVLKGIAPAPSNVGDILNWITPDTTKSIEASDVGDLAKVVTEYLKAREIHDDAKSEVEKLKTQIQLAMVDATTLTLEGKPVLTWKQNKDSIVVDHKKLAATALDRLARFEPDTPLQLLETHTGSTPGNRVFRLCTKKSK